MSVLDHFPKLNNAWVDLKHRVTHWQRRRNRTYDETVDVSDPRNVLIVVIDCLRADHVSGFGHERKTTPFLDDFEAAAFSNAKAPSTWTFPSVTSLLSGMYPHEHGARFNVDPRDLSSEQFPQRPRSGVVMLPELLEAGGYDTSMITAIPMAEKAAGDRFQHVSVRYTSAEERTAAARKWISDRDKWFCYLHLGDPHAPLDIPDEHRDTFTVPNLDDIEDWRYRKTTDSDGFEEYRDGRIRAYDGAIRGVDDALSGLMADIDEETVVVVCGDHGEAFWEHPELERRLNDDPRGYYATDHGHSVFEEVARVPVWMRTPNIKKRGSSNPVSLIDVFPTVLSTLGTDIPERVTGQSLEDTTGDRTLLCEETAYGYNQRAVWSGDQKVISVPKTETTLAFKLKEYLEKKPLETVPERLEQALVSFGTGVEGNNQMKINEQTRDRLEELGYLE